MGAAVGSVVGRVVGSAVGRVVGITSQDISGVHLDGMTHDNMMFIDWTIIRRRRYRGSDMVIRGNDWRIMQDQRSNEVLQRLADI